MDVKTKCVIEGILHELYLFRKSSINLGDATEEEFDAFVAEAARRERDEIDAMSPAELAADMIVDMLGRTSNIKGGE